MDHPSGGRPARAPVTSIAARTCEFPCLLDGGRERRHAGGMEDWVKYAWDWLGRELAGLGVRWLIVAVLTLPFCGWVGFRYRNMKREVEGLKERLDRAAPSIVLGEGATYNVVDGDQHVHYHLYGPAEVRQPKPKAGRVIPLRVDFTETIGVSDSFQAVLTKVDGTVEVHRSEDDGR